MNTLDPRDHEGALDTIANPYALVNAVVQRAAQLAGGAEPRTKNPQDINHDCHAGTAIREIRDGTVYERLSQRMP